MLILRGEGRALVLALRHALRSRDAQGLRILILSDNLALVLAHTRGRGTDSSTVSVDHYAHSVCSRTPGCMLVGFLAS